MIHRGLNAVVDVLLGEDPTVALERFLACATMFAGLWVLSPFWHAFVFNTALARVPEELTGVLMTLHGLFHLWALDGPRTGQCRRAALATSSIWAAVTAIYVAEPVTRGLFIIPVSASLSAASFLVFLRLRLLFHGP